MFLAFVPSTCLKYVPHITALTMYCLYIYYR